jgi:hypothetical protein
MYTKHVVRFIFSIASLLCALPFTCLAQADLLSKVPQLQQIAKRANAGVLGDGTGTLTLLTSRGRLTVKAGLDPIHVFGNTVRVSDVLVLLKARAAFIRTGAVNPMSGDVSDLAFVVLETLSFAKDPESIPVIADLLQDTDDVIRGWAAIALYRIAESNEELKATVRQIAFPRAAVHSAQARGEQPPVWLKIVSGI